MGAFCERRKARAGEAAPPGAIALGESWCSKPRERAPVICPKVWRRKHNRACYRSNDAGAVSLNIPKNRSVLLYRLKEPANRLRSQ
jgi:hypothetical protein